MARVGRVDGPSKGSFKFLHTLLVFRLSIYLLIHEIKIVTNILMGFKIRCQVGDFNFFFQNYPMYVIFWKIILKVWISDSNSPSIFFILCGYIDKLNTYLYILLKIVTNILMGFKILCQVENFEHFFKITLCTCVFEKSCYRRPSEARLIKCRAKQG